MAGEKTEKATPKRKQDERKKGNIFLSQEFVTVASLLAAFYSFKLLAPMLISSISESIRNFIAIGATQTSITATDIRQYFIEGCILFAKTALPILLIVTAASTIATMAQTRLLFSAKAFAFKGERINPLAGFKRMFSMRSVMELLKAMLKIVILLYILYSALKDDIPKIPTMMYMEPMQAVVFTGGVIFKIALQIGIIFIFLAAGDYLYQWWQYEKNLRMTKQEVKDEYKQMEGDPQVKEHIRSLQQQRARRRMIQNVPNADVVIRNPTHYAVAIKYDSEHHSAPVVIAKGVDALALRIVAVAEENGVYITENRPLARALYAEVEVDAEIPAEFYQTVAEILAFVYNLKKKDST